MSEAALLETLDKLVKLHDGLLKAAHKKTIHIKETNIEGLQELLKQEQTYAAAINTIEQQRQEQAVALLKERGRSIAAIPTLTDIQEVLKDPVMIEQLQTKKEELIMVVAELSQQNELNRQLTLQSLQFVNMTMDMIMPKQSTMNYSNKQGKPSRLRPNHSMFDSRT
ncbi:hypothetical protein KP78_13800 [Jeotgalibacillus soli]|uniref:FlgN family protein n=2 Tax=Jeotgalibacillus soli TaxID=889306 RepID=A0A0C2VLW7_9BACL|nr:hypothetical protein KP78_13800 [Jeotgalibacillus soli]